MGVGTAADVVAGTDLDGADPAGAVQREGVGPHPGADPAVGVRRRVRQTLVQRAVHDAVRVEVADDRQHRTGALGGGEEAGGQGRPELLPAVVVARVGGVVDHGGSPGCRGEGVGVGGVDGDGLHPGVGGVDPRGSVAGAAEHPDLVPGIGEQAGEGRADRAGADDDVQLGLGRGSGGVLHDGSPVTDDRGRERCSQSQDDGQALLMSRALLSFVTAAL
nr:hypothetical protein [Nocardioides mesophilus]